MQTFPVERLLRQSKRKTPIFLDVMKGFIPSFKEFPGAQRTQQAKNIHIEKVLSNRKNATVCSCFQTPDFLI